jgi:hypothetical protein
MVAPRTTARSASAAPARASYDAGAALYSSSVTCSPQVALVPEAIWSPSAAPIFSSSSLGQVPRL